MTKPPAASELDGVAREADGVADADAGESVDAVGVDGADGLAHVCRLGSDAWLGPPLLTVHLPNGTRVAATGKKLGFHSSESPSIGISVTPLALFGHGGGVCQVTGDDNPEHTAPPPTDIIFDVMWSIELEPEVEQWIDARTTKEFASVLPHIERLAERGSQLRMPASRSLGNGLLELRFDLRRVAWRITYYFATGRRIVLLTVFRKQRQNERAEVQRARQAMERCVAEGHTAEEDD